jgi:hypothetical protein
MANSTRNGRQPASAAEARRRDAAEIGNGRNGPPGESSVTLETPNIWHAGARSECWTSTRLTNPGSWGCPFAASVSPAVRLSRAPRRRTPLHSARPVQGAAARFFSSHGEFLTE